MAEKVGQCVLKQGKAYILHDLYEDEYGRYYTHCSLHINRPRSTDSGMYSQTLGIGPIDVFIQKKFLPAQYDFACPVCFPKGVSSNDQKYEL